MPLCPEVSSDWPLVGRSHKAHHPTVQSQQRPSPLLGVSPGDQMEFEVTAANQVLVSHSIEPSCSARYAGSLGPESVVPT